MIKLCSKCNTLSEHNKGQTQCKACYKEWYSTYKERKRDLHYQKKFNITIEEYNTLLEKGNGVCHSCRQPEDSRYKSLAVDHDHETGKIRGLLCQKCNRGIGLLGDDIDGVRKALAYLVQHYAPEHAEIINKYTQEFMYEQENK